ncbi:hypothetical protein UlMin_011320 [Ulmus minor]
MAATAPIAIGTRGTVGSLVRKEIEYFSKFELDRHGSSSRKARGSILEMASSRGQSNWSSLRTLFLITTWKRKKPQRSCSSRNFLPSICSVSEVSESNRVNGIPGFNYTILKDDMNNLDL